MSDAICPRCGDDNITDYPVCDGCASVAHFTHRKTCIHCERKHAAVQQQEQITALLNECGCVWYRFIDGRVHQQDVCEACTVKRRAVKEREAISGILRDLIDADIDDPRLARIRLHSLAGRAAALLARLEEGE